MKTHTRFLFNRAIANTAPMSDVQRRAMFAKMGSGSRGASYTLRTRRPISSLDGAVPGMQAPRPTDVGPYGRTNFLPATGNSPALDRRLASLSRVHQTVPTPGMPPGMVVHTQSGYPRPPVSRVNDIYAGLTLLNPSGNISMDLRDQGPGARLVMPDPKVAYLPTRGPTSKVQTTTQVQADKDAYRDRENPRATPPIVGGPYNPGGPVWVPIPGGGQSPKHSPYPYLDPSIPRLL
ncbi:MAG TPA: hypothetical protein PKE12_09745 [Kiritimatiellia bacterium]|nr:hypothetical protein [Kiritimatiellia bacterium]